LNDLFNLTLVNTKEEVDQINRDFYSRYNYPWPPAVLVGYPAGVAAVYLNQDVGCWDHQRLPKNPKIWVAGCGTNQALITALKFPEAEVLGTDISTGSLEVCLKNARQIGVTNLKLEERSLNNIDYDNEFDYIICTGVIHHNASPEETLKRIAPALKKDGILELMVYNYYHRILNTACQKAIRTFYDPKLSFNMDLELNLLQDLVKGISYENMMMAHVRSLASYPEAAIADTLLQPVEHSYTIESFGVLAGECNLEYLTHCLNPMDVGNKNITWNLKFRNENLQKRYDALPDIKRWQITNLLSLNESPMLWFYFQRKDSSYKRKTEQEICDEFLERKISKKIFSLKKYILNNEGKYHLSDKESLYLPAILPDSNIKAVIERIGSGRTLREILSELKIAPSFHNVNEIRLRLSTSAFPYLVADN
jgi:SAM-dependent methyltransferase